MKRTPTLLAVAVATTMLAAGCGSGEQRGNGATSSAPASSSTGGQSPTSTVGPSAGIPSTTPARPTPTRIESHLTGVAVRGVEPGCVGIKTKGKTYQLAGDEPRDLAKNGGNGQQLGRIKVSGHFAPKGAASTCMMGRVFVVVKMTKL